MLRLSGVLTSQVRPGKMFLSTVTTGLVIAAVGAMSEEEPEPPPHEDKSTITQIEQKYFIVSLLRGGLRF